MYPHTPEAEGKILKIGLRSLGHARKDTFVRANAEVEHKLQ